MEGGAQECWRGAEEPQGLELEQAQKAHRAPLLWIETGENSVRAAPGRTAGLQMTLVFSGREIFPCAGPFGAHFEWKSDRKKPKKTA
jgi:hypothetical protein